MQDALDTLYPLLNLAASLLSLVALLACPSYLLGAAFSKSDRKRYLRNSGRAALVFLGGYLVSVGILGGGRSIRARPQGRLTACKSNLKNIATSLEMYSSDNHGAYPKSLQMLTPDYLKIIPRCPDAGSDTYSASYQVYSPDKVDQSAYTVSCQGENHGKTGTPANYPKYSSYQGLIVQ